MATIDRIDREILTVLAQDARTTNKDLSRVVGLSQSACLERVRRLAERKILRGAHADVDPSALGIGVQAIVAVRLKRHTRAAVASFEKKALSLPQVVALYHMTGAVDFLAHVVARSMDHLRSFTLDAITGLPEVGRIETSVLYRSSEKWGWPDLTD